METKKTVIRSHKWSLIVIGCLAVLGVFWWKTDSWPVVAMVNGIPVTRFELNQTLYKQGGQQVLDDIVTRRLIAHELAKKRVVVTDNEINRKIDEVKAQLGTEEQFNQALTMQGLTVDQVKEQIKLQLGLEKLVELSTDSAKTRTDIMNLVEKLKTEGKVWTVNGLRTTR